MNHPCPLAYTDQDGDIVCGMLPIPCQTFDCERWQHQKENDMSRPEDLTCKCGSKKRKIIAPVTGIACADCGERLGIPTYKSTETLRNGLRRLVCDCHGASKAAGWWNDLHTGEPLPLTQERVGDKLMLIVTEIAEAKEGHRKGLMDTHLPHRSMIEVELADAVIRIADLAGALGLDLAGAVVDKLAYNANRPDHKVENRKAPNGKKT